MSGGWITLHRSIKDHWLYTNSDYFSAWIKMLLSVNFKDGKPQLIKGVLVDCNRGQSTYSLDTWADVFGDGWTKQRVRTFFKLLEKDEIINTENIRVSTRLTVCKYDSYQSTQHADDTQDNTHLTREQHAPNTHLTPREQGNNSKNDNKEKNEKDKTPSFDVEDAFKQFWAIFPKKVGKLDAKKKFAKAMKEATLSELLESLNKQKLSFEWTKQNGRYIPNPATWLNQGRWMDEIEVATPKAKKMSEMTYQEQQEHLDKIQANIMGARK